ncbi:unnamed protein product [Polarella glacialis]|uniref:Uncharacterized protein n=1 Tax=Polarella glacialis TaxID=89957 RepID=A0A813EIA8_POLGL|nr:unnamed protein product [Polarella glacialis]
MDVLLAWWRSIEWLLPSDTQGVTWVELSANFIVCNKCRLPVSLNTSARTRQGWVFRAAGETQPLVEASLAAEAAVLRQAVCLVHALLEVALPVAASKSWALQRFGHRPALQGLAGRVKLPCQADTELALMSYFLGATGAGGRALGRRLVPQAAAA